MAFTEQDRAAAEQALRRMSEHNDELLLRGMERLGQLGSTLQPGPPDKFWPTTAALVSWHQQQRRSIGAALGALSRMTRRVGTNGVNRYPTSEWGEPLALATWMRRVGGRPLALGVAAEERGVDGAKGELCPSCGVRPLVVNTRAKGFGRQQERRTFGQCPECKLALDLTESWDAEVSQPPIPRERAQPPSRPIATGGAPHEGGKPYFDELVNGWYRDDGGRAPLLVCGGDDLSDAQPSKHTDGDCWACGMAPHSRRYHDLQIAESLATHGLRRIEENGRVRIERTDPSDRFHDERAQ